MINKINSILPQNSNFTIVIIKSAAILDLINPFLNYVIDSTFRYYHAYMTF